METLQSIIEESKDKGYFSIVQARTFTKRCFNDLIDDEYSSSTERQDAIDLVKKIVASESQSSGSTDEYYDYAVVFARNNEYDLACDVLSCGLNRYPKNNDLLAYYLLCATKSSSDEHYKRCDNVYETLQSIRPHLWTWRAYDFSISYLLDKNDRETGVELKNIMSECLDLAHEFQKRIPTNELAYLVIP